MSYGYEMRDEDVHPVPYACSISSQPNIGSWSKLICIWIKDT